MKYLLLTLTLIMGMNQTQAQEKFLDPANIDKNVKTGDDFYHHFNGTWLKNNPVPDDEVRWGSFLMLRDQTLNNQKAILDEFQNSKRQYTPGSSEDKIRNFYLTGMDQEARNKQGLTQVMPLIEAIERSESMDELLELALKYYAIGLGTGVSFYIGVDDKDVTKYIPTFSQSGLGLPDRDYYFKDGQNFQQIRDEYKKYLVTMLKFVESPDMAERDAKSVYAIEEALAEVSMDRVTRRDPDTTYNKYTREEFLQTFDALDWDGVMQRLGLPQYEDVLVSQPEFLKYWGNMWKVNELQDMKAYYKLRLISDLSSYLTDEVNDASFAFYGKVLQGQEKQKDQWKRVLGTINGNVGELMGQVYVDRYFAPDSKEKMLKLVNNLQSAYAKRIKNLDWMSAETKKQALEKLNSFTKKIGYPDKWKDYSALQITSGSYLQNVLNSWNFQYNDNIRKYGQEVDKNEWYMTPQTVNAYYNPSFNEIVFPAAILAFPFFDPKADDAVNYGGIGAVIGHEMTHGFDDQGAKYAADGNLKNWWTEQDEKRFNELTTKLVDQFNGFTVLDTVHVNGELTLGENIADLGGIAIAYDAYTQTDEFKKGKKIDGYTPQQRFFMSWAQIWRSNIRPETALQYINTDPHSPGIWRCNGPVTNHDAWYQAFDINSDAKMYKPQKERIKIW